MSKDSERPLTALLLISFFIKKTEYLQNFLSLHFTLQDCLKLYSMKRLIVALLLLFVVAVTFSACKTTERCDAYKQPGNYSRY
jgi:hypothetical protein